MIAPTSGQNQGALQLCARGW